MAKDKNVIPGFIGEAMRSANLETVKKEEDLERSVNPLKNNPTEMEDSNDSLEAAIAENQAIHSGPEVVVTNEMLKEFQEKTKNNMSDLNEAVTSAPTPTPELVSTTQTKIISGKNGDELQNNINQFLAANVNIEIIETGLATAVGGIYYSILYKTKIERV